jgi:threonine aldolase
MDGIDRRSFLRMGSAGAASLGAGGRAAFGSTADSTGPAVVRMHGDGLALSAAEYAAGLARLAANGSIETDDYSIGGSVETLERQVAELLGKERAVFLPTGTLANQLAVRRLAGEGGRVLLQEESHLYNDSGDCLPILSRLQAVPLAPGEATFTLEQVRDEVERAAGGRVSTPVRALSIESPVRRLWGRVFDFAEMRRIADFARERGIGMHLDGARVLLAEPYTGVSPVQYAALFDTVYVSLWKYFNAASGAVLAGSAELLDDLFHVRRMFGGSLPGGWVYAAPASHYLPGFAERFAEAVRRSEEVYRLLGGWTGFEVERIAGGTNVARLAVRGVDAEAWRKRLVGSAIDLPAPLSGESAFKIQVNESWLAQSPETIAEAMIRAAS